tara:strand:+ start:31 stop:327 length:297 start_codon:yes stop_codon:yes gene_type:complete
MPFVNKNKSYSFNMTIGTSLTQLSGFTASEVLINNKSGQVVNIFDNERNGADQAFQLADSDSMVLRGITNTNEVSAQTTSGSGTVYFRSAYFSNFNQF